MTLTPECRCLERNPRHDRNWAAGDNPPCRQPAALRSRRTSTGKTAVAATRCTQHAASSVRVLRYNQTRALLKSKFFCTVVLEHVGSKHVCELALGR